MNKKLNLEEEIKKSDKILFNILASLILLGFGVLYGPGIYYDIKHHLGDETAIEKSNNYYEGLFKTYGNVNRYEPLRRILER